MSRRTPMIALLALGLVVFAACTSDDKTTPTSSTPAAAAVSATAAPATPAAGNGSAEATTPESIAATRSTLVGANEEFNYGAAVWQGYWLSRDHFGPFVMGSGLGIPFTPPMEMLGQAIAMVAQNPDDLRLRLAEAREQSTRLRPARLRGVAPRPVDVRPDRAGAWPGGDDAERKPVGAELRQPPLRSPC